MAALGWLLNLGFAGSASVQTVTYPPSVTILALPYVDANIEAFTAVSVTIQAYPSSASEISVSVAGQWVDVRISTGVYTSDVYELYVYE